MIEIIAWSDRAEVESLLASTLHAEGLPGWFAALAATTLAPQEKAMIATVRRGSSVRAAMPLAVGPQGARALTAPYTTRYVPALPDREVAAEMGRRVRDFADGVLRLDAIDPTDSGMAAFLEGVRSSGVALATYQGFANWTEAVTDFASYWKRRPSRLRTTVRRKAAAGGTTFVWCRDDLEPALAHYEAIHRASWKGAEPHPDFLATMVRRLKGAVRIGLLESGGQVVAAQIWLVHAGRGTIFKLVHREDAAALSPGTLLTRHMIERCIGEGVRLLDFGRGDDAYKRDWMGTRATRLGVIAADWRKGNGLRSIASDVVPTLAARAWRRHFAGNRIGSAPARSGEALAAGVDRSTMTMAEVSR